MFPQAKASIAGRSRFLYAWLAALLFVPLLTPARAATPARGLSSLHAAPLSVGYLNAIRRGIGTTPQNIAALNYEAVDIISLAFTLLNPDGAASPGAALRGTPPWTDAASCAVRGRYASTAAASTSSLQGVTGGGGGRGG